MVENLTKLCLFFISGLRKLFSRNLGRKCTIWYLWEFFKIFEARFSVRIGQNVVLWNQKLNVTIHALIDLYKVWHLRSISEIFTIFFFRILNYGKFVFLRRFHFENPFFLTLFSLSSPKEVNFVTGVGGTEFFPPVRIQYSYSFYQHFLVYVAGV